MKHRAALNRFWAALSVLWIAWCLSWPFYARHQDMRAIDAELKQTYYLCLKQKGMTPVACAADREAYRKLDARLTWPRERSVYQSFAGEKFSDAFSLMMVLCLLPVVFGYALTRAALEAALWFKSCFTSAPVFLSARRIQPQFHQPAATNPHYHDAWESPASHASGDARSPDRKY